MGQPVVHFEIGSPRPDLARAFYEDLFGWSITTDAASGYGLIETGAADGIGGGLMPAGDDMPPYVTLYVAVPDLEAVLRKAEELGAKRLVEPTPVPGMGAFAIFADPDGNAIGLLRMDATGTAPSPGETGGA
jgi:predicted enzyme related to lactoylglutathione lyase